MVVGDIQSTGRESERERGDRTGSRTEIEREREKANAVRSD